MKELRIMVDDKRDHGGDGAIIIRDPRIALQTLRRLHRQIGVLLMDNDMGYSFEFEGRSILKQFMQDCRNAKDYPPKVVLVTSNLPAAMAMSDLLTEHGYKSMGGFVFERT